MAESIVAAVVAGAVMTSERGSLNLGTSWAGANLGNAISMTAAAFSACKHGQKKTSAINVSTALIECGTEVVEKFAI